VSGPAVRGPAVSGPGGAAARAGDAAGEGESAGLAAIAAQWERELPALELRSFLVSSTILRLAARIEREFAAKSRSRGLGPGDMRVLLTLRRSGPPYALSPTALFRSLMITSGAVSKQVDRLAELGLVERAADPDQLRGILIRLRPAGHAAAEDMMREVCTSFAGLEGMPDATADAVLAALGAVQDALDAAGQPEGLPS
jgi:DNA-binding MarR family transcriptional regulator